MENKYWFLLSYLSDYNQSIIFGMSLGLVQAVANCTSSVSFLLTLSRIRFLYSQKTMDA